MKDIMSLVIKYGEAMRLYGVSGNDDDFTEACRLLAEVNAATAPKKRTVKVTTIEILEGQVNLFEGSET